MSGTSGINALFTGSSQFSSSLAQSIQRAVSFASLPMQQMQNDLNALQSRQGTANTLDGDFANLQSAIRAIESAVSGSNAFAVSVASTPSDPPVASATVSGTPTAGTYTVDVSATGAYSTAMSSDGLARVADPDAGNLADATSYTLKVGTATYTITPAGNTLSALEQALNLSGQVQATLVKLGTAAAPDYRLSLEGVKLGDLPIQLTALDGSHPGQALLTAQDPAGAPAEYKVNGQPSTPIQSDSPLVTVSPGVSVRLLGAGTATVTVSRSNLALSNALSGLASAYNTAMTDINKNRGQSGGALAGDSIVMTLSDTLHNIVQYSTGNSGIASLTALGFSFDSKGVLSFDPAAFASATSGQTAQLTAFFGSGSGGGFLKRASDALDGIEDPVNGILKHDLKSLASQITEKSAAISAQQEQVDRLQVNLTQQMAAADAAIAALEQQQIYMQTYFDAMQTAAKSNS